MTGPRRLDPHQAAPADLFDHLHNPTQEEPAMTLHIPAGATVRLALISSTGEVLDTTDQLELSEWNEARLGRGAWALLQELPAVATTASAAPAPTTCSYCPTTAIYVGSGSDGDFYCSLHAQRAPGGLVAVSA